MSITDIERVRKLITSAVTPHRVRQVERDALGAFEQVSISRPGFPDLVQFAHSAPSLLMTVWPSIGTNVERLVVCEALSEVRDASILPFWKDLIENETDEELLACAAIGTARLRATHLLKKIEATRGEASSARFVFHLGIARVALNDPMGIDYLIDVLQHGPNTSDDDSELLQHGPTMKYVVMGILNKVLPEGPGRQPSKWRDWWCGRRNQYRKINGAALGSLLAYIPPRSVFAADE